MPTPAAAPARPAADLRAFVECQLDRRRRCRAARRPWIPVPPVLKGTVGRFLKPSATITPLPTPGTARLGREVGDRRRSRWSASVEDGRLVLRPEGRPSGLLGQVYAGVDGWVGNLNDWLAANGYRLAPLDVAAGSHRAAQGAGCQ